MSKAIDKQLGCDDERIVTHFKGQGPRSMFDGGNPRPASLPASQWQGWGTALKPAREDWTLARKPLQGTVAQNVLEWGTGAVNIDGCRVEGEPHHNYGRTSGEKSFCGESKDSFATPPQGRYPANVIHDGSEEVTSLFPETSNGKMSQHIQGGYFNTYGKQYPRDVETIGDNGSAARFFYCAKAAPSERRDNNWPTVKPKAIIQYLVKLITPPGGIVLDPFLGSGTTAVVCEERGIKWVAIDKEQEAIDIAVKRICEPKQRSLLELCNT